MEILQQLGSLPIFIIMFLIIYFLMIRPQSIQQKNHSAMLSSLKKDDKVVTRGGILGKIIDIQGNNNEYLLIETANSTKLKILKSSISSIKK